MTKDTDNSKWWPILYVGRYADKSTEGIYIWKLRDELSEALDKFDLSEIPLYANEKTVIWKISHGTDFISDAEAKNFEEKHVIVVHEDTKAKATSNYFCGQKECTDEWMIEVVEYDILPMLSEYWFDEPTKLQRWENIMRGIFND